MASANLAHWTELACLFSNQSGAESGSTVRGIGSHLAHSLLLAKQVNTLDTLVPNQTLFLKDNIDPLYPSWRQHRGSTPNLTPPPGLMPANSDHSTSDKCSIRHRAAHSQNVPMALLSITYGTVNAPTILHHGAQVYKRKCASQPPASPEPSQQDVPLEMPDV
ncbi:hypothetical protein EDC04DRAFT_2615657 [Pisolithus marmoratus]|nr:hypothetical protein EDC04DRAFT_2615657 [Pisolithus marmoratus]